MENSTNCFLNPFFVESIDTLKIRMLAKKNRAQNIGMADIFAIFEISEDFLKTLFLGR